MNKETKAITGMTVGTVVYWLVLSALTYAFINLGAKWGTDERAAQAIASTHMVAMNSPKAGEALRIHSTTKLARDGCELSLGTYYLGEDSVVANTYFKHDAVFLGLVEDEKGVVLELRTPTTLKQGDYKLLIRGVYSCNVLQRLYPTPFSLPLIPFKVKP